MDEWRTNSMEKPLEQEHCKMNKTYINVVELLNVLHNDPEVVDVLIEALGSSVLFHFKMSVGYEEPTLIVFNDGSAIFISDKHGAFELDFTNKQYIEKLKYIYIREHYEMIIDEVIKHFFYWKREPE